MNIETNQARQMISKDFPIYYRHTDSSHQCFRTSSLEKEPIEVKRSTLKLSKPCNTPESEIEIGTAQTQRYETRKVIKLTSNRLGSLKKLSLFIDILKLEIKSIETNFESQNLLINSTFIASYMRLSKREKQILKQLSLMKTSEEIASELFISANTVKNHRKSIKQKLEFSSRDEQSRFLYWVRGFVS